ncbi:MAG: Na+/H+ antiporter NhaA [Miltoncostaeaceae bacterium]
MSEPPVPHPPRPRGTFAASNSILPRFVVRPAQEFMRQEASAGLVLLAASIAALIWANVDSDGYTDFWETTIAFGVGDWSESEKLLKVVNDGLMTLFFLVIGLEIKRELTVGELASRRAAALPAVAAVGGMVLPAAIYLIATWNGVGSEGWGIPIATDVAFALAALAALGRLVPPALVAFLLGVAVIDDILAIGVIAIFYTDTIVLGWLAGAVAVVVLMYVLNRLHVRSMTIYIVLGVAAWFMTFESGVHATIAGVVIGLITPARPFQDPGTVSAEAIRIAHLTEDDPDDPDEDAMHWRELSWLSNEAVSPLARIEHGLHRWTSFLILPIFALANAGIVLSSDALEAATENGVALGILLGLVFGKTVGITLGSLVAVGLGIGKLPEGVRLAHLIGAASLAGIGFTVSLFIAGLAFDDPVIENSARLGILAGSIVAGAVGLAVLWAVGRRSPQPAQPPPEAEPV